MTDITDRVVDALRNHFDESIRNGMLTDRAHGKRGRWGGMAEMIAVVAGTDRHDEYNNAQKRVRGSN